MDVLSEESALYYDRRHAVDRLMGLDLDGGSHAMLSAIGSAVYPVHHGWTSGAARGLRDELCRLIWGERVTWAERVGGERPCDEALRRERDAALEELARVTAERDELLAALRVLREAV